MQIHGRLSGSGSQGKIVCVLSEYIPLPEFLESQLRE